MLKQETKVTSMTRQFQITKFQEDSSWRNIFWNEREIEDDEIFVGLGWCIFRVSCQNYNTTSFFLCEELRSVAQSENEN